MAGFTIRLFYFLSLKTWMEILAFHVIDEKAYHFMPSNFDMDDHMGIHEKEKLVALTEDLVKEAVLKMRQIIEIRDEHDMTISFNIGMIMGRIREKYRFMDEIYRQVIEAHNNQTWHKPPTIRHFRPHHYIITLERLHYLELEIDKLVDVMIDEATNDLDSDRFIVGQTDTPRRKNRMTDFTDISNSTTTPDPRYMRSQREMIQEEAVKSKLRQRYLMKKLGNPINMTTAKKRFLRNWPVEGSWSLDKYNFDYK